MANLFDLDDNLVQDGSKKYEKELRKAKLHILREELDKALKIYEAILEEDMEVEEAYIGLLRVHSKDYTVFEGEQIEKDIRIITKMFDDIDDEDLIDYLTKRKRYFRQKEEAAAKAEEEKKAAKEAADARAKYLEDKEAEKKAQAAAKRKATQAARKEKEKQLEAAKKAIDAEKKANYDKYGIAILNSTKTLKTNSIPASGYKPNVIIPAWVKEVCPRPFVGQNNLVSVTFEGSDVSFPLSSDKFVGTFSQYYYLERVVLPSNIKEINDYMFHHCRRLKEISLPNGVTSIGNNAFFECDALRSVIIPKSVRRIGEHAFANPKLEYVELCDGVSGLEEHCFQESGIISLRIPGSIKEIPERAFDSCKHLTKLVIEEGVEVIGEGAFADTRMSSVVIPKSVKRIAKNAFENCYMLDEVIVKNLECDIDYWAFYKCSSDIENKFRK